LYEDGVSLDSQTDSQDWLEKLSISATNKVTLDEKPEDAGIRDGGVGEVGEDRHDGHGEGAGITAVAPAWGPTDEHITGKRDEDGGPGDAQARAYKEIVCDFNWLHSVFREGEKEREGLGETIVELQDELNQITALHRRALESIYFMGKQMVAQGPKRSTATAFLQQTGKFPAQQAQYFERLVSGAYQCNICPFPKPIIPKRLRRHEESETHQRAILQYEKQQERAALESRPGASITGPSCGQPGLPNIREPVMQLLDEIVAGPSSYWDTPWVEPETGVALQINWEAVGDTEMQPTIDTQAMRDMAEKTRQFLLNPEGIDEDSDSAADEQSSSVDSVVETMHDVGSTEQHASRIARKVTDDINAPFFPWPDRETAVLDILRHIPRSSFSRNQNEIIHWAMMAVGLTDIPSDHIMDDIDRTLQSLCGIESL
ncbi:hypothetical protein H0H81_002461, partial [Sphagnurus paluster]